MSSNKDSKNSEFKKYSRHLINMTIHHTAIYSLGIKKPEEHDEFEDKLYQEFLEDYRQETGEEYQFNLHEMLLVRIAEFADFNYLSCYIRDWLTDRENQPWRAEIERREQLINKASSYT